MSDSNLTLRDLLAPSEKGLSGDRRVLMESDPHLRTLKERLAKEAKRVNWDGLSDVLAQKAIELLDIPVLARTPRHTFDRIATSPLPGNHYSWASEEDYNQFQCRHHDDA
jgi:hypothetical protein